MILTDREISLALQARQILIDPVPDESAFSSTSIDLTLAREGRQWEAPAGMTVRPGVKGFRYHDVASKLHKKVEFSAFELKHNEFALGWTRELVEIPIQSRLAARVEGKSSLARLGLAVHITAPTIHAGFKGQIQLEIVNHGAVPIVLDEGLRICQLIFEMTLGTPEAGYAGVFSGQRAER